MGNVGRRRCRSWENCSVELSDEIDVRETVGSFSESRDAQDAITRNRSRKLIVQVLISESISVQGCFPCGIAHLDRCDSKQGS